MNGFFTAAFFVLASSLLSVSALAQTGNEGPPTGPANNYPPLVLPEVPRAASRSNRPDLPREDPVLKKGLLAPSDADRVALAAFLRTRNTGLIRLLPREVYESDSYKTNKKTLTVRGGGAYYSFALRTHEYGYGTDIGLEQGYLKSGFAGFNFGIMTNLGNVPFEQITFDHPSAHFVSTYNAPATELDVRAEQTRFQRGATVDETVYRSRLPVEVNSTYLVRSIDYHSQENVNVLVALRIVRKDTDGSIIIVWKILKKYAKPAEVALNK